MATSVKLWRTCPSCQRTPGQGATWRVRERPGRQPAPMYRRCDDCQKACDTVRTREARGYRPRPVPVDVAPPAPVVVATLTLAERCAARARACRERAAVLADEPGVARRLLDQAENWERVGMEGVG